MWLAWRNGRAFAREPKGRGFEFRPLLRNILEQAAHTHAPLSPSSIIWHRPMGGDAFWLGRYPQAWRKLMAVYRWVGRACRVSYSLCSRNAPERELAPVCVTVKVLVTVELDIGTLIWLRARSALA